MCLIFNCLFLKALARTIIKLCLQIITCIILVCNFIELVDFNNQNVRANVRESTVLERATIFLEHEDD